VIKAKTVEQFYLLKWLETNFETKFLEIKLIDRHRIKIRDQDKKIALITYVDKDNITLSVDTTF